MTRKEIFEHINAVHGWCAKYGDSCDKCPFYVEGWQDHFDEWEDGDAWCLLGYSPSNWAFGEIKKRLEGDA